MTPSTRTETWSIEVLDRPGARWLKWSGPVSEAEARALANAVWARGDTHGIRLLHTITVIHAQKTRSTPA